MLELLQLPALLLLVWLGFYVFVADPRSRAHQTFAAFIAFLALWTTKDLIFWNFFRTGEAAEIWAAVSFIIALLMQYALVVFAWVFPENARTPRRKAAVLFAPGIIFAIAAMAGLYLEKIDVRDNNLEISVTPIAYAFVAYVYFLFFYGAFKLFRKYQAYRGTQKGSQLAAILLALAVTLVLKSLANIILPFFGIYELLPYSALFILPGVVIYAYAISNFRLFSLQTALDQFRLFPITYKIALAVASVAIISFVLFQIPIVWWSFRNGMDFDAWRKYLVFSVISALVPNLLLVLLIVRSISRPLQRITVAAVRVTEGEYGTEVDLRRSNDELGLLADSFNEMSRKMAFDIERLQSLNERLARAERLAAMGTLAAGVAHEVNNPLASISSLVQMIRESDWIDDETRERLDLILTQIRRISRVTKDLTDFARIRPAARQKTNLNQVIESALRLAGFDSGFQKLDVSFETDETIGLIEADPDQLQQVFLNLFLNARDAMPQGGRLSIKIFDDGDFVCVRIEDTGTGMEETEIRQVFDPFFTTKPPGRGTGLGLSVCYGIISAHGGRIEVESKKSAGSVFTVRLPVSE
ncbi:MAG: ATP-binding protein [Acidobacteriota bacterium]|jgi:signal transduction histidine kinase